MAYPPSEKSKPEERLESMKNALRDQTKKKKRKKGTSQHFAKMEEEQRKKQDAVADIREAKSW